MDVAFDTAEVPIERRPQTVATHAISVGLAGESPRTIRFRLPCGGDQEAVLDLPPDAAVAALLERCIVDDGGVPLAAEEGRTVIEAMEQRAPQVEPELDLTCPECGHAFEAPFDIVMFFVGEMRLNAAQLLRETHALALAYHWSEADILGLDRDRRRAYLDLLRESLPRA